MYTVENFKTKKALKAAVAKGRVVTIFQPGPFRGLSEPRNGEVTLEGPHYPLPHRWYARATVCQGCVIKVK